MAGLATNQIWPIAPEVQIKIESFVKSGGSAGEKGAGEDIEWAARSADGYYLVFGFDKNP